MLDFVIVILVGLCAMQPVSLQHEMDGFIYCLNKWPRNSERKNEHSAFLTDPTLVEEICKTGVSVNDMDKCVRQHTDNNYINVIAYWNGIKAKYTTICDHFEDFMRFEHCRLNENVVKAYEECPRLFPNPWCRDYNGIIKCVKDVLHQNCKELPFTFFANLLETELMNLMNFISCPLDPPDFNLLAIQTPTSTSRRKQKQTTKHPHRHQEQTSKHFHRHQELKTSEHPHRHPKQQNKTHVGQNQQQQPHQVYREVDEVDEVDLEIENIREEVIVEANGIGEEITIYSAGLQTMQNIKIHLIKITVCMILGFVPRLI